MSYNVYWVKNRAEKIADFEHPTFQGALVQELFNSWTNMARWCKRRSIRVITSAKPDENP